jgi:predicted nucleic acid-binding protein
MKLRAFRQALDQIATLGLHVLPVERQHVLAAGDISLRFGLLSGDALVVAFMQERGLALLSSNDADFDRVPGITRLVPL